MAKGINKVILIGNLGQDPEIRYTPDGIAYANLSIATNESWKDRETGEQQDRTEWHRLVFSGRLAAVCGEYLHKGSKIYVEGKLRTRKWTDKGGVDHYTTSVYCHELQMLDGVQGDNKGQSKPTQMQISNDEFDDEIPF